MEKIPLAAIVLAKSCIQDLSSDHVSCAVFWHLAARQNREAGAIVRRNFDYSLFFMPFEAQSLGDVLPFIRAHRPKLPHLVYGILNYRMRNVGRFAGRTLHRDFG
jgi:hypothetical protein